TSVSSSCPSSPSPPLFPYTTLFRSVTMNSEKLGLNGFEKGLIVLIPILTAVIFYYLPFIFGWIEMIPFLSDNQLINFITSIENSWLNRGLAIVGFIIGLFLSIFIFTEILKMEVNRDYVTVDIFDKK